MEIASCPTVAVAESGTESGADAPASASEDKEHWAIRLFEEELGGLPSIEGQELIAARVHDANVWKATLAIWKGNGHSKKHVGNLVDRYDNETKRREQKLAQEQKNGQQKIVGHAAHKPGKYDSIGK